jgi:hypothetical protein
MQRICFTGDCYKEITEVLTQVDMPEWYAPLNLQYN